MSLHSKIFLITLGILGLLSVATAVPVAAQETPRPTPTTGPTPTTDPGEPTATPEPGEPTATPEPGEPTATPEPGEPTATPEPGEPTATPEPGEPTATPNPGGGGGDDRNDDDVNQGSGTIRGAVYQDVNGDGRCIGTGVTGEGAVAGVPIEFVSGDEQTVLNLTSGADGTYGLVAVNDSNWSVSVRPGNDWVVTSDSTVNVPIFENNRTAENVNFCVQRAGSTSAALLPNSGASAGSGSLFTLSAAVGVALLIAGAVWQRRQSW